VKELVALAKQKPDTLTYGTTGPGTIQRIATEYFAGIVGIKLVHVPYRGANETTTAILAGEVDMTINGMSNILPHMAGGKLKALAISTLKRNPLAPDVPTRRSRPRSTPTPPKCWLALTCAKRWKREASLLTTRARRNSPR
jgi:tripartite-type tricarboxylate transporter receptor subunit TctC